MADDVSNHPTLASWRGRPALILSCLAMATLGFNRARIGEWTLADLVFVVAVIAALVALLGNNGRGLAPASMRRSSPLVLIGSLILLTAGTLSSLLAHDMFDSMMVVFRFAWLTLIWFWLLRTVCPDRHALYSLINAYKVAVLISSVAAIIGYVGLISTGIANPEGRETAYFFHPNDLGGFLLVGLSFFIMDIPRSDKDEEATTAPAVRLVLAGIVLFAIGTTGSLTAALGAIVAGLTVGALRIVSTGRQYHVQTHARHKNPLSAMMIGALFLAAAVVFAGTDSPLVQRFTNWQEGDRGVTGSVESRGERADAVLDRFDTLLIVGLGFDPQTDVRFATQREEANTVHNMYLKLLNEAGLPAVLGLLLILVAALHQGWLLILNTRDTNLYPVGIALVASIVAGCAFAMFQPIAFHRYFWLPIALTGALWALRRQELQQTHHPDRQKLTRAMEQV